MAEGGFRPPGEFEEYRLLSRLGQGAMGQVWLARDTLLERYVAIKFLSTGTAHPTERDRFLLEARAVARLSHPNVVTIHRVGTLDGLPYIVSEYLQGTGLDRLPRPVPLDKWLRIAVDLARGLGVAHRAGVLHRDVKPANAFLCESGEAKLLDFGLAKLFDLTVIGRAPPLRPVESHVVHASSPSAAETMAPPVRVFPPAETMPAVTGLGGVPLVASAGEMMPPSGRVAHTTSPAVGETMPPSLVGAAVPNASSSVPVAHTSSTVAGEITPAELAASSFAHTTSPTVGEMMPPILVGAAVSPTSPSARVSTLVGETMPPRFAGAAVPFALPSGLVAHTSSTLAGVTTPPSSTSAGEMSPASLAVAANAPVALSTSPSAAETLPPATASPSLATYASPTTPQPQDEGLLGTPLYLAPECFSGAPASRASDIYAWAALVYELAAGQAPARYLPAGNLAQAVRDYPMRPLAEVAAQVPLPIARLIDRCLDRDPAARAESIDLVLDALTRAGPAATTQLPVGNPYRGLSTFEAEHRAVFFGRSFEVRAVIERLRADPMVLITGASGVGKSSLARAGVLPQVHEGALGEARAWRTECWVPGRRPLTSLATQLAPWLELPATELLATIREEPQALVRLLGRRLGRDQGLVLLVDQFEELLTVGEPGEVELVSRALAEFGLRIPGLRLLATVRADLLPSVQALPALDEQVLRSLYLLGPLRPEALVQVVEAPAAALGVSFESREMIDEFAEFARAQGSLPIVQFALAELFDARVDSVMTQASLRRLGGVAGSLARHADGVMQAMAASTRLAARAVLLRLATEDGTKVTRDAGDLLSLQAEAGPALEALVRGRLVVARSLESGTGYELAHEALLTQWPQLADWLREDDRARLVRQRLRASALEWQRLAFKPDVLWSQRQLTEAQVVDLATLPELDARFLAASRRARWQRRAGAAALAATVLAAIAGGTWWARIVERAQVNAQLEATLQQADATARELSGDATRAARLRAAALSQFQQNDWPAGEQAWVQVLALEHVVEVERSKYLAQLEAAFSLDPARSDVKERLAGALFEAAQWARTLGHEAQFAIEFERLRAFDPQAKRWPQLEAPAQLTVHMPAGVTAEVVQEARSVQVSAVQAAQVPAGAWVLRWRSQASSAQMPVLLDSGERLELSLAFPSSPTPPGFALVPAGRFYFGATGDDDLRRSFYEAAPAHLRETAAYFIAKHEVTVEEYLAFLESLPPRERAERAPHLDGSVAGEAVGALVELTFEKTGPRYRFRVSSDWHEAKAGEPVRYPKRDQRAEQNWLKFPITGVSAEDFEAYAAWLSKTGRVPGARLCTELEWERAARGADRRAYPHGDVLEPDDANFDLTYHRQEASFGPDEVGSHPRSDSPFGVSDLSGNVWEVVHSAIEPGAYVIRGGCFFVGAATNRLYNRSATASALRLMTIGSRVCADADKT